MSVYDDRVYRVDSFHGCITNTRDLDGALFQAKQASGSSKYIVTVSLNGSTIAVYKRGKQVITKEPRTKEAA